ncbi:hypothetical protein [Lutispora thermophila]|uniref:Uncharacterized protein n=1 Tax=Lutispora thermophila DSM 19022 TaxID=1122184 RepID=A0A1M6DPR3_9FIRM|nr:hypothetical protein [Lutispora thermophila]SHI75175.1 hypothetical protein SAMN02745176_01220 [Lutispora thermophila DSM 19022]
MDNKGILNSINLNSVENLSITEMENRLEFSFIVAGIPDPGEVVICDGIVCDKICDCVASVCDGICDGICDKICDAFRDPEERLM